MTSFLNFFALYLLAICVFSVASLAQSVDPTPSLIPSPVAADVVPVESTPAADISASPSASPSLEPPSSRIQFQEVTSSVGITQPQSSEQFGGATVADLDGDGHYDLILTHHTFMRIFYGSASGRFTRSRFFLRTDIHGVCVAQRSARSKEKLIAIATGGGRGTNLRPPFVYLTKPDRSFTDITNDFGLGQIKTRGRTPVFMDLSMKTRRERRANKGGPDVLFVNLLGNNPDLKHFAYQNVRGEYTPQAVPGFESENEERAIVTDIDNDGIMELVHFSVFKVFKLIAPFQFQDITKTVAPGLRNLRRSVSAVVELDFNNDGFMDLYLARANSNLVTPRGPPSVSEFGDVLLMNQNGKYIDVSSSLGVPQDTNSMAVSAEDFNNDGYVDIIVSTFEGPDFILLNQEGTGFERVDVPEVPRPTTGRGSGVMAMDYDMDGRVDFIVGQAFRKAFLGQYYLMKNTLPMTTESNYLHVRVGNEPTRACTSLNAIVTIFVGKQKMVRRVGGRGAQAGGQSYIDTVHFGLGRFARVNRVTVRWTTGAFQAQRRVDANQRISFGVDL